LAQQEALQLEGSDLEDSELIDVPNLPADSVLTMDVRVPR
jgi:hypothetical protein